MFKYLLIILILSINTAYALNKWECVNRGITCNTWRLWVPPGWIVSGDITIGQYGYAMTYFPDPEHIWKL